jgi:MFS transporter, DHA1 family, multidrug resistance protein
VTDAAARAEREPRKDAPDPVVATALVSALLAITPFSLDIALPALPSVARAFDAAPGRVQLVVALFLAGMAAGQLAYGPASDRFGRRPVLLGALGLYVAATVLCAVAWSLEWLAAGRLLQGLGACAAPVVARAVVRDVYEPVRGARVLSVAATGMALAPIVSSLLGGVIVFAAHWRVVFVALSVLGALLLAGVAILLEETNTGQRRASLAMAALLRDYALLASDRRFLGYALTLSGGSVGLFAWISGSPFVLMTLLGLPAYLYGVAFATVNLGQLAGALVSARLVPRVGIDRTIGVGLVFYLAGGLTLLAAAAAGARHPAAVVAPMALFQFGNGMVMPNTVAGAIAPFPHMAGAASALAGFLQMVAGSLSGIVLGRLHDGSARPMAALVAGAALGAAAAFGLVWTGRDAGRRRRV